MPWAGSWRRRPRVGDLISLPGNPGLSRLGAVVEGISVTDVGAIAAMARVQSVDLVVVGPEAPLAAGVVDAVATLGIPVFGPTRAAARLESSKTFAKEVMTRAGVATAASESFTEPDTAREYLSRARWAFRRQGRWPRCRQGCPGDREQGRSNEMGGAVAGRRAGRGGGLPRRARGECVRRLHRCGRCAAGAGA